MGTSCEAESACLAGIFPLIPTEQAGDRCVCAPLCRVDTDTVPLSPMGKLDGNRPPVPFHSIRQMDGDKDHHRFLFLEDRIGSDGGKCP